MDCTGTDNQTHNDQENKLAYLRQMHAEKVNVNLEQQGLVHH